MVLIISLLHFSFFFSWMTKVNYISSIYHNRKFGGNLAKKAAVQFTILACSSTRAINKLIPRCTLRVIFCLFFVLQLLTSNSMSSATWLDLKLVRMGSLVSWNCLCTYLLNYHRLCHNRCLS